MRQASLKLPQSADKAPSLHEVIVECVRAFGPRKQAVLAAQLGAVESHLSEVMGGKGKWWPDPWIEFIAKNYDPENRIARCVAAWKGLAVREPRRISDAAWRRATEKVLGLHNGMGAALRTEIEAEALAEAETDEATPWSGDVTDPGAGGSRGGR